MSAHACAQLHVCTMMYFNMKTSAVHINERTINIILFNKTYCFFDILPVTSIQKVPYIAHRHNKHICGYSFSLLEHKGSFGKCFILKR